MEYKIEEMKPSDWQQVKSIYLEGIKTRIATFQTEFDIPDWDAWNAGHVETCRLVACSNNTIQGWAALSPTSAKAYYAGVVEVSIYLREECKGQGIGTALLKKLIEVSEANGYWSLYSGIIKENTASIALHKKCGFREIGFKEKVGKMNNGKWHDVVLMEKRSSVVGID